MTLPIAWEGVQVLSFFVMNFLIQIWFAFQICAFLLSTLQNLNSKLHSVCRIEPSLLVPFCLFIIPSFPHLAASLVVVLLKLLVNFISYFHRGLREITSPPHSWIAAASFYVRLLVSPFFFSNIKWLLQIFFVLFS